MVRWARVGAPNAGHTPPSLSSSQLPVQLKSHRVTGLINSNRRVWVGECVNFFDGLQHHVAHGHRSPAVVAAAVPEFEILRTEETIEGAEGSSKSYLEEERGVTVEGLEMSVSTGFHCHGATRHVALHLTSQCPLRERTTTE